MTADRIEDGGPAFPHDEKEHNGAHYHSHMGMSLRDYFAGLVLAGMATGAGFQGAPWDKLSADAYEAADAMISARQVGLQTGGRAHG